ncbi:hypothetical protein PIB30_101197 [Stylosanthes scabra]|uniref:CCHC-type domain-containing protein n=1 Tax=Stylosanthes scabra TaxID=79078 RepID=A0ABU6XYV1_9FABA|nr:hypothetical protein [Stylosanthes scabra]
MKYEGLVEIPPVLILRRWCKDAKEFLTADVGGIECDMTRNMRYGKEKGKGVDLDGAAWSNLKDPNVAATKKGKESAVDGENMHGRKRKCTSCGVAGHTKRSCAIPENESGWGCESGGYVKVGADSSSSANRGRSYTSAKGNNAFKVYL